MGKAGGGTLICINFAARGFSPLLSEAQVDGVAVNGLRHGKLRAKVSGYHETAANAPEPPETAR